MKNVMLSTLALALSLYTNAGPTQKASKAPRVSHEDEEANIKDTSHLVKFISEILTLASCGNEELLVQIKRLSCTNCELRDIPSEFFHLSGLEELILNNNNLCYVTPNIAKFKSLKILDLSNNRIKELPETIGEMRSLIDINLSNNFLEKLPNKIANLRQLERLTVRHNTLKKLPSGFSKLKQLQYLDIR
ncbi:leucine-rich repeat domain-containing protein, partial [bacterium]|nr:leucine-rich repeat domain-containing protein [bacterium]